MDELLIINNDKKAALDWNDGRNVLVNEDDNLASLEQCATYVLKHNDEVTPNQKLNDQKNSIKNYLEKDNKKCNIFDKKEILEQCGDFNKTKLTNHASAPTQQPDTQNVKNPYMETTPNFHDLASVSVHGGINSDYSNTEDETHLCESKNHEAVDEEKNEILVQTSNHNVCIKDYPTLEESSVQSKDILGELPDNNNLMSNISNSLKVNVQSKNESNKDDVFNKSISTMKTEMKHEVSMSIDEDTVCGFGKCTPKWMQKCATARVYVILYSVIGVIHGSYYPYLIGTLSTLEKRFAFRSKISGSIMIADEITPLFLGIIIGYYAGKTHRPRMLGIGMFLSAGCSFATSLPYFIYGPAQHLTLLSVKNQTGLEYCHGEMTQEMCGADDRPPTLPAVLLLVLGSFLKGFGNLAYYAIGLVYMDDNSNKQNTPLYLAVALALRLLGPLVGFVMSSTFLKFYENPFYDPGFGPEDPRWIGAWWMGFFLQGVLLVIFSFPIAMFPRRLPSQAKPNQNDMAKEESFKELFVGLFAAVKRLAKNPIFVFITINTIMTIFGHYGHYIMMPKYMENQFRLTASDASLLSGPPGIACVMFSTVLGGFIIWKYKPSAKLLLGGMVASEMILGIGFLTLTIPRCQSPEISHFGMNENGLILDSLCNKNCDCSTTAFTPYCNSDGKTLYFSPCYAGCTIPGNSSSKESKIFGNCSCVTDEIGQSGGHIIEGFCPDENCWSQTLVYIILLLVLNTISSTFTVAHTMVLLRSVHPDDKSVALGTFETLVCLFGFIPYPITFGSLVDSACLIWEKSCGETGNCWFYNLEKYNYLLHGAACLFCVLSALCLLVMYFLSSRIRNLYDEEDRESDFQKPIKLDTISDSVTKL